MSPVGESHDAPSTASRARRSRLRPAAIRGRVDDLGMADPAIERVGQAAGRRSGLVPSFVTLIVATTEPVTVAASRMRP